MKGTRSEKVTRIVISVVVVVLALIVVGGYIWFYGLTRAPLPQHDGELTVDGLHDTVQILRDERGVPHIYTSNMHDLYFAQGYTHAQDRWWQMEFFRHTGNGQIEELTGKNPGLLGVDIFIRSVVRNKGNCRGCSSGDHLQGNTPLPRSADRCRRHPDGFPPDRHIFAQSGDILRPLA